jgi:hypothetical protein
MSPRIIPALVVLATLSACARRSDPDTSIGAPEGLGGASVPDPPGATSKARAAPPATYGDNVATRDAASAQGKYDGEASVRGTPMPEQRSPGLGTAYGEQRFSSVRSLQFRRADPATPTMLLAMRYNDADGVHQMAHYKTGQYPQRASHQSGQVSLTLRDESGAPLPGAQIGGDRYAVGEAGARYTIGIENHSVVRYEVVASVDGLDVIDGAEADLDKRGYLIDPYTSFVIEGWRTGDDTVAAFRFSDMDDSYAGRSGKPRNIGVIGVALFQEEGQVPQDELRRRDTADPFPNRYAPPPPGYRANGY